MTADAPPSKPTASAAQPAGGSGSNNPFAAHAAPAQQPAPQPSQQQPQAPVLGVPASTGAGAYAFGPPGAGPPPPLQQQPGGWYQPQPGGGGAGGPGWGPPPPPPGPVPFDVAYQQAGSLAPLPFGGIGYQLPLFLFGWLFAPCWFIGAGLPACGGGRDPRERYAWSLNVCMSVLALAVAIWVVTAASTGSLYRYRW